MALRIHNPSGGTRNIGMPAFVGATNTRDGRAGSIPAPLAGQEKCVLLGAGGFGYIQVSDIYNLVGNGAGAEVTLQTIINAIVDSLMTRTTWHRLDGSSSGEGGEGGSSTSGTTTLVDTYNITGNGAGETVSVQQLADAIINRFDERTTWNVMTLPSEDPEETSSDTNEDDDSINLNEESSNNEDLYDQIQNNYDDSAAEEP